MRGGVPGLGVLEVVGLSLRGIGATCAVKYFPCAIEIRPCPVSRYGTSAVVANVCATQEDRQITVLDTHTQPSWGGGLVHLSSLPTSSLLKDHLSSRPRCNSLIVSTGFSR